MGGAAGVEYVETSEVTEEVELPVAKGDEILLELFALLRCETPSCG